MKKMILLIFFFPVAGLALDTLSLDLVLSQTEGPIGLIESYRKALKNNERVAGAQESYLQALYYRKQVGSVLLPDITLEGIYFQQEQIPSAGLSGQSFLLSTRRTYYAKIEQTLFNGFRERNGLKYAGHLLQASEQNLRQERDDLLIDVAAAFYDSLKLQREVETLEDSLRLQRERLREVEARQKIGLARRTEVLLIETQVANDEAQLIRSKNGLQTARERLNFLVGESLEGRLVDDVEEVAPTLETELLIQNALHARADLREADGQVAAARSNVSVIRGEYLPELELTGNVYARREGIQSPVSWDVEVSVKLPIFFGSDIRARELQARSKLRQAELSRQQLERQIHLEVKTALLDWLTSDALIISLQKEEDLAQENYDLIEEEYRIGLATNLEVLTSYILWENARLELEKEKINRKFAWMRLQTALGENPAMEGSKQ